MYVGMFIRMLHIRMYVRMYVHTNVSTYLCIYVCKYTRMYECIQLSVNGQHSIYKLTLNSVPVYVVEVGPEVTFV
jgi:hypothetical protein